MYEDFLDPILIFNNIYDVSEQKSTVWDVPGNGGRENDVDIICEQIYNRVQLIGVICRRMSKTSGVLMWYIEVWLV